MRSWYARRGIPWLPLLACLALAASFVAMAHRWPHALGAFLPGALASCAAATGFLLDEPSTAAVSVTPRGGRWARVTRCLVAGLPLAVWCFLVATTPASTVDRSDWVVAGVATQALALGLALAASSRGSATPGSSVAAAVAGLALAPFVVGPLVGWTPL